MSAEEQLTLLVNRRDRIREWLEGQAAYTGTEQKHLDPDTPERAYWHHGYQAALDDMIELLSS
jgi:hypothetical protein